MLDKNIIERIFILFQKHNSHPKIELQYHNHFTLLISIILSAQTTDIMVNKVTPTLFAIADTPYKMSLLNENQIKKHIRSLGLYNIKAKNILKTSKIITEKYNNQIPETFDELMTLPGIGRKSANVVLNTLYHADTIGVDTHVFRVSNRIGLCKTKTVYSTEKSLLKSISTKWRQFAHQWLVLHGRYICKSRKPQCSQCFIMHLCQFKNKKI